MLLDIDWNDYSGIIDRDRGAAPAVDECGEGAGEGRMDGMKQRNSGVESYGKGRLQVDGSESRCFEN